MCLVMFGKQHIAFITGFLLDNLWDVQFFPQPKGHGFQPGAKAFGGNGQVAEQQPFKGQERLVVENDVVQLVDRDSGFLQTILNGIFRETRIMFFSGESLFLGCCQNLSIFQQARSAIVIESGDTQNMCIGFQIVLIDMQQVNADKRRMNILALKN